MKTLRVLQVLPYFPPHKGGLETVAEEWGKWYVRAGCGSVLNATFSVGQADGVREYEKEGYRIVVIPAFDLIANFPFPKIWSPDFWSAIRRMREFDPDVIQTHTRFFLSTLLGGVCAKLWKKRWCHVEHGSDYVQLSAPWKNAVAYGYDRIFWKWTLVSADIVVPISRACQRFIQTQFHQRRTDVIYRGIDAIAPQGSPPIPGVPEGKTVLGFVGRLVAWKNVHSLIAAYKELPQNVRSECTLVIVGDGEEIERLKSLDPSGEVIFTGALPFAEALAVQSRFDVHVHPPIPGGGLATTLIQAMQMWKPIVATRNEGATDVIVDGVNGVLVPEPTPEALADGIVRILELRDQWVAFAQENQKIVADKFDWSRNVLQYHELFLRLFPDSHA